MAFARTDALHVSMKSPLFHGMAAGDIRAIVERAKRRRYSARQILLQAEDTATVFFLLLSGQARHYRLTPRGKRLLVRWSTSGGAFGLAALLQKPTTYGISTEMVRAGEALAWDRDTIQELAHHYPALFANAFAIAMGHIAHYHSIHLALTSRTAEQRLAKALLEVAESLGWDGLNDAEIDVKNKHLADMANVNFYTASRILSAWQRKGWIRKRRGKIVVQSCSQLRGL